jgi:hypothetical protein
VRGGQIGTAAESRAIFIWEGAVAVLPDDRMVRAWERVKCNLSLYDQAVGYWQIQGRILSFMWTLMARTDLRIDMCVTTRGTGFARAVANKAEHQNWPVRYVFAEEAPQLGRNLAYRPDVKRIYYGLEEQRFAFGPHGYHIGPDTPLGLHNA